MSAKARKLFEDPNLLFVATVNRDGSPQVTPVWTALEDANITFNTSAGGAKEAQLAPRLRIGLSIAAKDDPYNKVDVVGTVIDMIVGDEADAQIDDLSEKYLGQRPYSWRRPGQEQVKVIVEPMRICG